VIFISLLDVKNIAASSGVRIYPNPTSGIISLDWGGRDVKARLTVFNVVGQVMLEQDVNGKSRHDADLSELPGGNYILSIKEDGGRVSTHKVVLVK
jgi:hypothetical protein